MQIIADVSSFQDSYVLDKDETPPPGASVSNVEAGGETRQRVVFTRREPSTTSIHVPGGAIDEAHENHKTAAQMSGQLPNTRLRFLADHVDQVFRHHSAEITGLDVPDDFEAQAYLRQRFGVGPRSSNPQRAGSLDREGSRAAALAHYAGATAPTAPNPADEATPSGDEGEDI